MELEKYPPVLKAEQVAEILGCSKRKAYDLMEQKDFPLVRLGRLKRVGKEAFVNWLERQAEAI